MDAKLIVIEQPLGIVKRAQVGGDVFTLSLGDRAEEAWRGAAQRTVDDAEMRYVVVHLHRLLEPDMIVPAND